MILSDEAFLSEVRTLLERAEQKGIPLRTCGAVGVYLAIEPDRGARAVYRSRGPARAGGGLFKDLDLVTLEKYSSALYRFFIRELSYREDRETNALFGSYRNVYFHPGFQIDVFFDKLNFSHEIPIRDRLLPGLTLPPEDLLLTKLQIHDVTRKDLIDLGALAHRFPVDQVDRAYLGRTLSDDWGFWYDADQNLRAAVEELARLDGGGEAAALSRAAIHLRGYQEFLTHLPKTRRWRKRAERGTRETWYEPVDEIR